MQALRHSARIFVELHSLLTPLPSHHADQKAPTGRHISAQGNALGNGLKKVFEPCRGAIMVLISRLANSVAVDKTMGCAHNVRPNG